ncbi:RnfABCDGE type electron transport complex subunit D [Paenibacillus solisilvae]|uniref:RnfABCDGE type electron transport complex subunit D n=1 Tax=Paenibacillus solisilvae TaxID=2486751 RepID=A0ABW0W0G6_9BACL
MSIKQWTKTPKAWVFIAIAVSYSAAAYASHNMNGLRNGIVAIVAAVAVDVICGLIEKRKRIFPDGAVITGLIVASILSLTTSPWVVAGVSVIAILSKHLLTHKKKPVFNPAVFGLLVSILLFQSQQSWWGAFGDLPAWLLVLPVIGGYLVINRINKFPQVFTFLGTYFVLLFVLGTGTVHIGTSYLDAVGLSDALRPPFVNAAVFFALFMLTDPPTSPAKVRDQIVFGFLSAAVGVIAYGYLGGLMYLFIGLMTGNLYQWARSLSSARPRGASPTLKKVDKISV